MKISGKYLKLFKPSPSIAQVEICEIENTGWFPVKKSHLRMSDHQRKDDLSGAFAGPVVELLCISSILSLLLLTNSCLVG